MRKILATSLFAVLSIVTWAQAYNQFTRLNPDSNYSFLPSPHQNLGLKHSAPQPRVLGDSIHAPGTNVMLNGTVYLIDPNGFRRPYTSAGDFISYGFNSFATVQQATGGDAALPIGAFIPPFDGSLIDDGGTIYFINNGQRQGFTTFSVFSGLGYSLDNVLSGDTSFLVTLPPIDTVNITHPKGTIVSDNGTIYLMACNGRVGIPNQNVFFSWGYAFRKAVPANSSDLAAGLNGTLQQRNLGELSPNPVCVNPAPNTITVNSPNGGEQWALGSQHTISWTDPNPSALSNLYSIFLVDTKGLAYGSIVDGTSGTSFIWTVGQLQNRPLVSPANNFLVQVVRRHIPSDGSAIFGQSAAPFAITQTSGNTGLIASSPGGSLPVTISPSSTGNPVGLLKLAAQNSDAQINRIKFTLVGSTSGANFSNLKLFDITSNQIGSTIAAIPSDNTVTFNLATPVNIAAGTIRTLRLISDLSGGAGTSFQFTIQRPSDIQGIDANNFALTVGLGSAGGTAPIPFGTDNAISISGGANNNGFTVSLGNSLFPGNVNRGQNDIAMAVFQICSGNSIVQAPLNSLTISRIGVGADSDLTNFALFLGPTKASNTVASLNNGKATLTIVNDGGLGFSSNFCASFTLKASVTATASIGDTVGVGLSQSSDIGAPGANIFGNFPINGSLFTVANPSSSGLVAQKFIIPTNSVPSIPPLTSISARPGDKVGVQVNFTNNSNTTFTNVAVMDPGMPGLVSSIANTRSVLAGTCAPGCSFGVGYSLTVSPSAVVGTSFVSGSQVVFDNNPPFLTNTVVINVIPAQSPSLAISSDPASPSGNIMQGASNVAVFKFNLTAQNGDISISSINLGVGQSSVSDITSYSLFQGSTLVSSGTGLNFPVSLVIPNGQTVGFTLNANVSPNAKIGNKIFYASSSVTTVDPNVVVSGSAQGNTLTIAGTSINPVINVISPNGGEQWQQNTTQQVKWFAPSSVTNVNLFLTPYIACLYTTPACYIAAPPVTLIASNLPNTGSYNWAIGTNISQGQYLLTVSDATVGGSGVSGSSAAPFNITGPVTIQAIAVLSPKGGEQWPIGSTQTVSWSAPSSIANVNIYLTTADCGPGYCSIPLITVARNIPNSGSYAWTIPPNFGAGRYTLYVNDSNVIGLSGAGSSNIFSLVNSVIPVSVTAVSPRGGESLTEGRIVNVSWTFNGPVLSSPVPTTIVLQNNLGGSARSVFSTIASNAATSNGLNQFAWTIPVGTAGGPYRVSVQLNQQFAQANGNFIYPQAESAGDIFINAKFFVPPPDICSAANKNLDFNNTVPRMPCL